MFLLQRNDTRLRDAGVFPRSAPVLSVEPEPIFVRREIQILAGREVGCPIQSVQFSSVQFSSVQFSSVQFSSV